MSVDRPEVSPTDTVRAVEANDEQVVVSCKDFGIHLVAAVPDDMDPERFESVGYSLVSQAANELDGGDE